MGLLNDLFSAVKGGAREVGEAIRDANGIRIVEQQLVDSEKAIDTAKRELTNIMAESMKAEKKVSELKSEIEKHEQYAISAVEKGNESLALEVAEKVAKLEEELAEQQRIKEQFDANVVNVKAVIETKSKEIADMKRQLSIIKATEEVQKTTSKLSSNPALKSGALGSAKDSLERIKQKQQDFDLKLQAGEELNSDLNEEQQLEAKLKNAGILDDAKKSSAQDVLERLKNKKK